MRIRSPFLVSRENAIRSSIKDGAGPRHTWGELGWERRGDLALASMYQ